MKRIAIYSIIGLTLWGASACKQTTPDRITPTATDPIGVVGTFVSAKTLQFNGMQASISALAVDSANNLYAADNTHHVILKIDPTGKLSTFAGAGKSGYQDGPVTQALFNTITSLAFDKTGNLYVAEGFENTCIRKITPAGVVSTFAGQPILRRPLPFNPSTTPDGQDTSARFIVPIALSFDSANNLMVADVGSLNRYSSDAIRRITPNGYVSTIAGSASPLPYKGGVIDNSPTPFRFISLATSRTGKLVGLDSGNQSIYQINPTGDMQMLFNRNQFSRPTLLLYDNVDNLLVASYTKIWLVTPTRSVSALAGAETSGFVNDSLAVARFGSISAMAIDKKNTLYIADEGNTCIRRVRLN